MSIFFKKWKINLLAVSAFYSTQKPYGSLLFSCWQFDKTIKIANSFFANYPFIHSANASKQWLDARFNVNNPKCLVYPHFPSSIKPFTTTLCNPNFRKDSLPFSLFPRCRHVVLFLRCRSNVQHTIDLWSHDASTSYLYSDRIQYWWTFERTNTSVFSPPRRRVTPTLRGQSEEVSGWMLVLNGAHVYSSTSSISVSCFFTANDVGWG